MTTHMNRGLGITLSVIACGFTIAATATPPAATPASQAIAAKVRPLTQHLTDPPDYLNAPGEAHPDFDIPIPLGPLNPLPAPQLPAAEPEPPAPPPAEDPGDARGTKWVSPAPGPITSGFGPRWGGLHKGVDIANDIGTPVSAASAGTVVAAGTASGYGVWVKIAHPGNIVSIYGHLNTIKVRAGQRVATGQQIATMGNRGRSTGPHLHFQVEVGGRPTDPVGFYRQHKAVLR